MWRTCCALSPVSVASRRVVSFDGYGTRLRLILGSHRRSRAWRFAACWRRFLRRLRRYASAAAAARSVRAAFCLRWGDARLLFWRIRSHQLFGRNVNLMLQSVYFLVCSSESLQSSLSACLVPHRPLGWEPFGFSKRAMRSFQPPRTRLCAFPTPRPGPRPRRRRASRGPRGRNCSPAIPLRLVAVDEGGGVSGVGRGVIV